MEALDFYGKACGLPKEDRILINGNKVCPDCLKLKQRLNSKRKCLVCDIIFEPGCLVTFTCMKCFASKSVERIEA